MIEVCWRSKEYVNNVLLWILNHGTTVDERPWKMYIQQLTEDAGCQIEDLKPLMEELEEWREAGLAISLPG